MPFRYRDAQDQNALKTRIVERVLATGSLEAACREEGMPHHDTVRRWTLADVSFGEALALARRRGWFRLKWAFDDAKVERVLAHIRTGGTIYNMPTGPDWPTLRAVRYWRGIDSAFAAEVWRLQTERRAQITHTLRSRTPRAFNRATADRVIVAVAKGGRLDLLHRSDPTLPGMRVIDRWRREDNDFATGLAIAMRVRRAGSRRASAMLTPELKTQIVDRIRQGASLASLGREADMPAKTTMYGWIGRNEEFARAVMAACDDREDWWGDVIGDAMDASVGSPTAMRKRMAPAMKAWQRHQNRPGRKWRKGG